MTDGLNLPYGKILTKEYLDEIGIDSVRYNTKLKPGDQGTVTYVDALGTIFVDWDNGSKLGLIHGEYVFRII